MFIAIVIRAAVNARSVGVTERCVAREAQAEIAYRQIARPAKASSSDGSSSAAATAIVAAAATATAAATAAAATVGQLDSDSIRYGIRSAGVTWRENDRAMHTIASSRPL